MSVSPRRAEWIEMVMEHVCEHMAEVVADLSDNEIKRRSAVAVDRALAMGLTKDGAVAAYASLLFLAGPGFDAQPAIRRVLKDAKMPPDERVEKLMSLTKESDWEEAAGLPGAWE